MLVLPLVSGCAIWVGPPLPVAVVTVDPRIGNAPLTVTFDGSESYERFNGEIEEYKWDFGDGTEGKGETVTHTYPYPGDYTATLRVINRLGLKGEATISVCAIGSGGDPGELGPLTGRWEGTVTCNAGPGAQARSIVLVLIESAGEVTGSALLEYDPDYPLGKLCSIQGARAGSIVTLFTEVVGSLMRLEGTLTGDSLSGTCRFRGEWNPWQVSRVE